MNRSIRSQLHKNSIGIGNKNIDLSNLEKLKNFSLLFPVNNLEITLNGWCPFATATDTIRLPSWIKVNEIQKKQINENDFSSTGTN